MATLKLLVEGFRVDANKVNAYGNTAIILAARSTMNAFNTGDLFGTETGVEV